MTPKNATDLVQPCNSFITQNLKSAWRARWKFYKMKQNQSGRWMSSSGKLTNPEKRFFLKLAFTSVCHVNKERNAD